MTDPRQHLIKRINTAMDHGCRVLTFSGSDLDVILDGLGVAPAPVDGWRAIETAPKDGRAVLLLSRAYTHESEGVTIDYPPRCNIGKWNAEGTSWVDEHGQLNDEGYHHLATTGVWESGGGWFQPNEVTHWQPLPSPPGSSSPPSAGEEARVTLPQIMRAMCSIGGRCSCADNNSQWRDLGCEIAERHARAVLSLLRGGGKDEGLESIDSPSDREALTMTRRRPSKADPFDVWGKPPQIILDQLGYRDHDKLRRYINRVASKVYRIAYDCGVASRPKCDGCDTGCPDCAGQPWRERGA